MYGVDGKCLQLVQGMQMLRYCRICNIYRGIRTVHCYTCQNCVVGFDHHCLWLGTCIGARNYLYDTLLISNSSRNFMVFLVVLLVWQLLVLISCALELDTASSYD